jgi:hypothetical protein
LARKELGALKGNEGAKSPSTFIEEKKWLLDVSSRTVKAYRSAFKAFDGCESEGD